MDRSWKNFLYNPFNMVFIGGYPNTIPKETNKWFPKFVGNNVVTVEEHPYAIS
jgi:hypothetical protein